MNNINALYQYHYFIYLYLLVPTIPVKMMQIAPYDQLQTMERLVDAPEPIPA